MDEADLPEEARRELANRRRDLEREFDAKLRDLKAQHQRRHDALKREQAEWEEHRRAQAKLIADRTETVRRRADNAQQRVDLAAAEKKELAELREQVKELERAQRESAREQARLKEADDVAQKRLRSMRAHSSWAAAGLFLGVVGWVATGWQTPAGLSILAAALAVAFLLSLQIGRRRPKDA